MKCIFYLLVVSIIISCSSTLPSRMNSTVVPEDYFGMVHAGRTNTKEEYLLLDELGVKWILNTFYWGSIEREKDNFDFSHYDKFVDTARQEGKKIIAVLGYETSWLFPEGRQKRYISPENMPLFLRFAEETVKHFKGRIDAWQIWNEPNFIFWKGSAKEFYVFTSQTAKKIRETNPDAYILGGAFCRVPAMFIKNMYKAGAMDNLDGISFHPYAIHPTGAMRLYEKFLDILSETGYLGQIWITEAGYPTGGLYPSRVSYKKYPSYIVKTLAGAAARGARIALWYQLFDDYNQGEKSRLFNSSENFFGLVYPDYQRKDGAWAFELCAAYLPGSHYTSDYPIRENIPNSIVSFCFLKGALGFNTLILWNDRSGTQKINLQLTEPAFVHDISTGNKSSLQTDTVLEIGKTPVFVTWQGEAIPRLSKEKK